MVPNRAAEAPRRGQADNATAMRTLDRLFAAIPTALVLSAHAAAADFEAGQVWSAKGRAKDHAPQLLVLKLEPRTPVGDVVLIQIKGVRICLPNGQCGDQFSPLAISKSALDQSVNELLGNTDQIPDFAEGYRFWKDGIAKGAPVTITVPLADALDQIEGGSKIQVK